MNKNDLLSWAGGLFDAEGCFTFRKDDILPIVSLNMTCRESILDFKQIVQIGSVSNAMKCKNKSWKDYTVYRCSGPSAASLADLLLPYLFTKRKQAQLLIEYSQIETKYGSVCHGNGRIVSPETLAQRQVLYDEMRLLNQRGRAKV